jgi:hypothetical protein
LLKSPAGAEPITNIIRATPFANSRECELGASARDAHQPAITGAGRRASRAHGSRRPAPPRPARRPLHPRRRRPDRRERALRAQRGEGLGLSALPCFAAHCEASLIRLTPALIARGEAFLVIPPDHRETVRIRLVMDAVTALFERERNMLEGAA